MPHAPPWLHERSSCPSTNTWAIAHLAELHHGDVVFTRQQTAGRGQHGRIWHSPPGVLTASFILDAIPAAQLPTLSLAAGLAVIYAIADLLPAQQAELQLKWCNDVLWHGRKLAGILCEASTSGQFGRVVVGIGLNRCVDFDQAGLGCDKVGHAISLHQLSPQIPDELQLLERLRHYLLETAGLLQRSLNDATPSPGFLALLPAIRDRDALLGHTITIDLGTEQMTGEAAGINDRGHLLLRLANGQLRSFTSGHILWGIASHPAP